MKTYTGTEYCRHCDEEFDWVYIDDGYRKGAGFYVSPVIPPSDPNVVRCKHNVIIPGKLEYFTTYCPHCHAPVSIECNERILEELNT